MHSEMIGTSPLLQAALHEADTFARSPMAILITGENGTGKELLAARIHASSGRSGKLVPVNCGAIAESLAEALFFGHTKGAFTGATSASAGLFKEADGGTLFLDEIGELPLSMQVKLLRVLETSEFMVLGSPRVEKVNVRIIAATNRDLWTMVKDGKFREDLYWRVHGAEVCLPPLRDRGSDIVTLAENFLARAALENGFAGSHTLSSPAVMALFAHKWTGNVRELRNAMLRASVLAGDGKVILLNNLPRVVVAASVLTTGNVSAAAPVQMAIASTQVSMVETDIVVGIEPKVETVVQTIVTLPAPPPVEEEQIESPVMPATTSTFIMPVTIPAPPYTDSEIKAALVDTDTLLEADKSTRLDEPEAEEMIGPTHYFVETPVFAGSTYIQAWRGMPIRSRSLKLAGYLQEADGATVLVSVHGTDPEPQLWRVMDVEYRGTLHADQVKRVSSTVVERWKERHAVSGKITATPSVVRKMV